MTTVHHPIADTHPPTAAGGRRTRGDSKLIPAWRVAAAVRQGLERAKWPYARHGRKRLMQLTGMSKGAADNRLAGRKAPNTPELVALIAGIDEVAEEILRLAGRADLAQRATALCLVRQAQALIDEAEKHLPPADMEHLGAPSTTGTP